LTEIIKPYNHTFLYIGGMTFYMDSGCLLIKIGEDEEQHPLTPQATHRLLNFLFDNRQDIIDANVAAKRYEVCQHSKHKKYSDASS
jgi:hypothetical protein